MFVCMKRLFFKVHLWMALPFGIIITVICLTGAILVFEPEVDRLVYPDRYSVDKVGEKTLDESVLKDMVQQDLPEGVKIIRVIPGTNPESTVEMKLSKPRKASLFVDPYTGEIKGRYERIAFFRYVFRLHRWLLDSKPENGGIFWGRVIVGVSTLMFVVTLVTGVIIWWPRKRKALKKSLRLYVRKGSHRFMQSLHIAGGMYAVIFLLLMSVTGLTWSFEWFRDTFYSVFGLSFPEEKGFVYSLHIGSWGGMVTRILHFVAALIGASLPVTGYYLWLKRKR